MQNKKKESQTAAQKEGAGAPSRDGWNMQKVADEASQKSVDEIQRETLRGDETKGDADERDIVGNVDKNETWQGREEAKNDREGKANRNG